MDLRRFKEYKVVIEEAIRQANLTENVTIHPTTFAIDNAVLLTTTRNRECILLMEGPEIHVLKRVPHSTNGMTFVTRDIINLADPGSVLQLGVAIKDLLNFSYWSRTDDLG